ncbi:MAG: ATP synthase F0 subunit B, partial [Acidimicrobiales bacterium]|nr:ATP synthase F0 subunit B [Acidimicrobiales bacterium]
MRRFRLLFAGLAVVLLGLVAGVGTAHAVSEEELREECIHILEEGGTVDDCHEAPSPILPEANEVLWGGIAFLVLLLLLWKFGYPAMAKGLDDRAERIRSDLEAADTAKNEAEATRAEYEDQLRGAREEATRMRDDARAEMDDYKAQRRAEIDAELAEYRERAKAEADA